MKDVLSNYRKEKRVDYVKGKCWIWQGKTLQSGYGVAYFNNRIVRAHRLFYQELIDEIENGLYVCHKCDVRLCVNPKHLFLGTQQDNFDDMVKKGRSALGERNRATKLDSKSVAKIRANKKDLTAKELADKYEVSLSTIYSISSGSTWKHLPVNSNRINRSITTHAKVTEKDVLEIRARKSENQSILAEEYGISQSAVSGIVTGKTWKHLLPQEEGV